MSSGYIVVGTSKGKVAGHASTIDSIVRVYRDGKTEESKFSPSSTNPGQETLQHIDKFHAGAEAIITREMQGPSGYNKRAIINDNGESIDKIVEKYQKGEYDSEIEAVDKKVKDTPIGSPTFTGEGKGVRAQKGRGGHPPEEQEEYGKGSGTKEGRAEEEKPQRKAYSEDTTKKEIIYNNITEYIKSIISQPYMQSLIKKYQTAKTEEERAEYYNTIKQTLRSEAIKKGLEGKEIDDYIESELEKQIQEESKDSEKDNEEETNENEDKKASKDNKEKEASESEEPERGESKKESEKSD